MCNCLLTCQRRFYDNGFPSVAQMACQQDWYAVLNLARRQVLTESELIRGTFGEKTAREWALHYKLFDVADELAYYVSPSVIAFANFH